MALLWKSDTGGVTSINELAVALDPDRFEVILLCLGSRGGPPVRPDEAHQVFCLSEERTGAARFTPALIRLARVLRTHHVDVLHCHNPKANICGTLAAMMAATPVLLVQFHGLRRTRGLRRRIENLLVFRRAAKVICVAEAVRQDVIKTNWRVNPEKLLVLENSVDYERFAHVPTSRQEARDKLGVPADGFVFGNIGRLVPTKGLSYLLDAFAMVNPQVPAAQLVLLGEGSSRADLEQQAARMPCRQSIHFLGHRPGVEGLLRGLDVFVLSSVAEGMPRAILEAMAAGIPCVATEVGGIPEVLDGSGVGLLAPPRDAAALAQKMIQIARMPDRQRATIGAAAQERVRKCYSHAVIQEKLGRIYEREFVACETQRKACS